MQKFIQFICVFIFLNAGTHAMQHSTQLTLAKCLLGEQLSEVVSVGDQAGLERLIKAGAPVNYIDHFHETALMRAVWGGYDGCLCLLINAGARINHTDDWGYTALRCASMRNYQTTCELLVTRMLWMPNQNQKKGICVFLGVLKKRMGFLNKIGLHALYKERENIFVVPFLAAVYQDNAKNFQQSVARRKVGQLPADIKPEGDIRRALLAKFDLK